MKWNASANFIGLGYTTLIGVVVLPLYLQYLGAEAFGVVGFFLVLQAWLHILDLGMSPLISRQAAYERGRSGDYIDLQKLLRSLEILAAILAVSVFAAIAGGSETLAKKWLNVASLGIDKVSDCIVLIGAIIGLRFLSSLYRSGIQGLEEQVRLNAANILLVTLKFVGALLVLIFLTHEITHFFIYQLAIGLLELLVLKTMLYRSIPVTNGIRIGMYWESLKPVLPFAGGMAYTAAVWVLLTQFDKLVLSNILPLAEYGYFSLVAVAATGISQVGAPISQAILPRMTYLLSRGNEQEMVLLYRQSTQLMAAIILPLTAVIAVFSRELLFAWTGDREAAEWAGPVLFWFALGNGILAIGAFQFYLQFAHGNLRMHVIFNSIAAAVQVPVIVFVAYQYGVMAVAVTWFVLRLLSFLIWTPVVHRRFARGIHWSWLVGDIGPSLIVTSMLLLLISAPGIQFEQMGRFAIIGVLFGLGIFMVFCNTLVSRAPRNLLLGILGKVRL